MDELTSSTCISFIPYFFFEKKPQFDRNTFVSFREPD